MKIIRVNTYRWRKLIKELNQTYADFRFTEDFLHDTTLTLWVVINSHGEIVAFAGGRHQSKEQYFAGPCGVIPEARGQGLQFKLLALREEWARQHGYKEVITYAHKNNFGSLSNIIKSGYQRCPAWDGDTDERFIHFKKMLRKCPQP